MNESKETIGMSKRPATLAVLIGAAALLALLIPALNAAAARADSPWWQLLTGSHPSNLQLAPDRTEIQEVVTEKGKEGPNEYFAAKVEVGGEVIGCLGTGAILGGAINADTLCGVISGYPASETAAEFEEMLEGAYGPGVEVSGGPTGGEPFVITTPERWVPKAEVTAGSYFGLQLGSASSEVRSEDSGRLVITLTNLGDAPVDATGTPLKITDKLPEGVVAYNVEAVAGFLKSAGPVECSLAGASEVNCSFEGRLPSYEAIEVEVYVALESSPPGPGEVLVSGANAPNAHAVQAIEPDDRPVPFGLESFSMRSEEEGGTPAIQAGAHPFQVTSTLQIRTGRATGSRFNPFAGGVRVEQPAVPRNVRVAFPPGLIGNATAVPQCPLTKFLDITAGVNKCPDEDAIGVVAVTVIVPNVYPLERLAVPLFNLVPSRGEPARIGFVAAGDPVLIDTSVSPEDHYRILASVPNATQVVQFLASTVSVWGNPSDSRHDSSRGWNCVVEGGGYVGTCEDPSGAAEVPFMRQPVSCSSPLESGAELEPWNVPLGSVIDRAFFEDEKPVGCNQLPFDPSISDALTSKLASNPSGLDLRIDMPNSGLENPKEGAISETQFKRAEITFPKGVTVNPSIAEGLAVCSEVAYERERFDSKPGEGCPEASKIGSVQISTPLLEEEVQGAVYQATPYENKTESLIGLYLVAKIPDRGILIKQPIEVRPDPQTGQLLSIADDVPQLPFSSFKFHFREGGRAPLITPPGCGTFNTLARFVPWSAQDPDNPAPSEVVERTAPFTIERGVDGGSCPSGPAPFHPGFEAGTLNNQAGSYSPFLMHLTRGDGEQDMGRFSFVLPPGVVPKLAGIPYCSDAAIAKAMSRQGPHGGQEEKNSPSCPAASEIGHTLAGAGVGNQLTYVPGKLYLAGPYNGDPISAVSITPAVAGPFDAGTVVVREALRLNPVTHVGEVDGSASDPIPHILKGIPLELRDLRVYADKPEFTLNPTSCEPFAASSRIWGDGTALQPLPEHPVDLDSRFQAAGCASLGFKPKLSLKLKGGTRRAAFPALKATYVPREHDANLQRLLLTFPHSEFIEQGHFRTICTRVQFAAGKGFGAECPQGSIYGRVEVWTPLLDEPLQGPVYLRSSNHNLPDAVFALHGLVDIEVAVRIDSAHGGLRASVEGVPDAPVSKAIVEMQGGAKGLFVNSTDLCRKKHRALLNATGQNGRRALLHPAMQPQCAKAHRRRHKTKRGAGR